jgi:hypothetical protein
MTRIFFAIAACCLMSGCATRGVDVNADPFARKAAAMGAVGADLGDAVHRTALVSPNITQSTSLARSASLRDGVPSYYLEKSCKTRSSDADSGAFDSCVQQEAAARDKLTKEWKSYSAVAREECASASRDPANSYVALVTCFEMLDWIKDPASIGGVTGAGATHAKNVPDLSPEPDRQAAEQASSAPETPSAAQP